MAAHQSKKTAMLRHLEVVERFARGSADPAASKKAETG